MSWAVVLEVVSWLLLGAGALVIAGGGVAILRMPTFYTRVHAAGVNETLGPGLILAGLVLRAEGQIEPIIKLVLIFLFLVLTGPLSTHALAKSAFKGGVEPGAYQRGRNVAARDQGEEAP
ncbi:MAG: monovalent cation/H(+) antiporter subunit G [Acidobacteriota bacterium]